jgi:hypothetical protein
MLISKKQQALMKTVGENKQGITIQAVEGGPSTRMKLTLLQTSWPKKAEPNKNMSFYEIHVLLCIKI